MVEFVGIYIYEQVSGIAEWCPVMNTLRAWHSRRRCRQTIRALQYFTSIDGKDSILFISLYNQIVFLCTLVVEKQRNLKMVSLEISWCPNMLRATQSSQILCFYFTAL